MTCGHTAPGPPLKLIFLGTDLCVPGTDEALPRPNFTNISLGRQVQLNCLSYSCKTCTDLTF